LYFQPYGDEQQLNLNWIINEIINLHKQLDPDYETPSFTQVYPYSNLNRLNLDWILSELKALKELAPEPTPEIDIQAVAEALVALPFDSTKSYQIFDYISRDGEIWRATEPIAAGGEWDETKWFKTTLGTDLAVLERWINSINNSLSGEIEARQNADTTLQTNIDNEALARQQADTALQNTINGLTSANISDDSNAGGATIKASLNNLKGSLNSEVTARQDADTALQNKLTPTQITPVLHATSFTIESHNVQYMGGYALGYIVMKCIQNYTQENTQYITMPWTFGQYAPYAFQPCTITAGEWDRIATKSGRVYCNAYNGGIGFPSCDAGEYISIYICLPVTLNS